MAKKRIGRRLDSANFFTSFTDVALLMLNTFIFIMVVTLMTSRMTHDSQTPDLKSEIKELKSQLAASEVSRKQTVANMDDMLAMEAEGSPVDRIIEHTTFGRKDFDLFVKGLKDLPGDDVHLVIDASGSMHGLTSFLVPVLRAIVMRSGKRLGAITWFSDTRSETYTGSMGEMFDRLVSGAPFSGNMEMIGAAFRAAGKNAPPPGAYLLVGDEPGDDSINYNTIASPVFTLPLGRSDPDTTRAYRDIAIHTQGRMLELDFK